jgi:hypothetical protein
MAKRRVHYVEGSILTDVIIGHGTFVQPVDHPDRSNVSNTKHVYTSAVIAYDPATGEFETQNSLYTPVKGKLI